MTTTVHPPRPRMRPPRPWIPDDPPETVLPAWMYARREPHFPHRVIRPAEHRAARPGDDRPDRPRTRQPDRPGAHRRPRNGSRALTALATVALLVSTALHGCASLSATCPL
ncbi:MAG TPA: hypothetical protein VKZ89_22345 [Thermobifida alba]|nr:hypothetical protein [Thermobifida alba]